jgi:hypothetical protein
MADKLWKKWTVRVDEDEFAELDKVLHHGQPSALIRTIIRSLIILIKQKRTADIASYIYQDKPLTLPLLKPFLRKEKNDKLDVKD